MVVRRPSTDRLTTAIRLSDDRQLIVWRPPSDWMTTVKRFFCASVKHCRSSFICCAFRLTDNFPERSWQMDIIQLSTCREHRSNLRWPFSCNATTDTGNQERFIGMLLSIRYEIVNIFLSGVVTAHRVNGVTHALHAMSLPPNGTEFFIRYSGGTASMGSVCIASEYKYFIGSQMGNVVWSDA